jgi:hypothetical protein
MVSSCFEALGIGGRLPRSVADDPSEPRITKHVTQATDASIGIGAINDERSVVTSEHGSYIGEGSLLVLNSKNDHGPVVPAGKSQLHIRHGRWRANRDYDDIGMLNGMAHPLEEASRVGSAPLMLRRRPSDRWPTMRPTGLDEALAQRAIIAVAVPKTQIDPRTLVQLVQLVCFGVRLHPASVWIAKVAIASRFEVLRPIPLKAEMSIERSQSPSPHPHSPVPRRCSCRWRRRRRGCRRRGRP